jgi:hypothetical protein
MSDTTIEAVLGAARRAAFAGGLTRLLRIHLRIGPDAGVTGAETASLLRERWQGPLFWGCEISWEEAEQGSISVAAVEGMSVARS